MQHKGMKNPIFADGSSYIKGTVSANFQKQAIISFER